MLINRMGKQIVIYSYDGILYGNEKSRLLLWPATWTDLLHCVERSQTRGSIYMTFKSSPTVVTEMRR